MRLITPLIAACLLGITLQAPLASSQTIASKVENQGYSRHIKLIGLMARERNGFLSLQIELANSDNETRHAYYRIKWLDEEGFQVWDDEPWKPIQLHGSQKQNLQAVAPTIKARDFRIQFNAENNWANNPIN
jgi:uncharacterized protein YcfL